METAKSSLKWSWQHFAVAGSGLFALVLLVLANKTVLENSPNPPAKAESPQATKNDADASEPDIKMFGMVPAFSGGGKLQGMLDSLKTITDNQAKIPLMKSVVEEFQVQGRLDLASLYADRLARIEPNSKNLVAAGGLLRNASLIPPVASDSIALNLWSSRAIENLEKAVLLDSNNTDALIELGLAFVQSQKGENSMKGIQTLKKVLDLDPGNQDAGYHLGVFSAQTGQWEKAEARLKLVKKGYSKYLQARFLLASVLAEQSKKAESRKIWEELASQEENSEIAAQSKLKLKN